MRKSKEYAEITALRIEAGIRFKDLAKIVGYSPFWLRELIHKGDEETIRKTKAILHKKLS